MRRKYVCLECETEFDEPKTHKERHGLDTAPFEVLNLCPECGSEYYVPAEYCDLCGRVFLDEYIITANDVYICDGCYTKGSVADV